MKPLGEKFEETVLDELFEKDGELIDQIKDRIKKAFLDIDQKEFNYFIKERLFEHLEDYFNENYGFEDIHEVIESIIKQEIIKLFQDKFNLEEFKN